MFARVRELVPVFLIGVVGLLAGFFWPVASCAQEIPRQAHTYRGELTRNARMIWGINAPVATFAAQVHQESGWRPDAISPVGAQGIAQFMPSTADWIAQAYPSLAARQPFNPVWGLRAMVMYNRHLWNRIPAENDCERMAMTLASYNGGLGWVWKDQKLAAAKGADAFIWFGQVELFNSGRSAAAFRENRGYPRRIIHVLQFRYLAWGPGVCNEGS